MRLHILIEINADISDGDYVRAVVSRALVLLVFRKIAGLTERCR